MKYKSIIIIGTTSIIAKLGLCCSEFLPTIVIENALTEKNKAVEKKLTDKIPFMKLYKKEIMAYLLSLSDETLCISFMNHYIFTEEVVRKKNLSIVNFHPALLPKYPGRNSTAWAIYNGEIETGITWHYIDENVDNGHMIVQSKILICDEDTAGTLLLKQLNLAEKTFVDILPLLLNKTVESFQLHTNPRDVILAKDIPNNGVFDLGLNFESAGRFLRSMDYGFKTIFPPAIIKLHGEKYKWKKYKILKTSEKSDALIKLESNDIIMNYKDGRIVLKNYEICED